MKKCKRWIAVLLISVMCLSLCGCQDLEDMRAAHALLQEDGSILWNGDMYCLMTVIQEKVSMILADTEIWVTEEDVPVLLSESFGQYARISRNGVVLVMYDYNGATLYCREDMCDFMTEHLKEFQLTTYYYDYWTYEDDPMLSERCYYYLSETQSETIDLLIMVLDFTDMDEDFYYSFGENDFCVTLGKCDDAHFFGDDYVMNIARKDSRFYLITPDNSFAQVPSEYDDIMKIIVSVYYNEEIRPYT